MSRTLTAMSDGAATSDQQQRSGSEETPQPSRGPYISVITNRFAPRCPIVSAGVVRECLYPRLCSELQDHQPADPRGHAVLRGRLSLLGAQPAPGPEKRHPLPPRCHQQHLLVGLVGATLLWHSLR